MFAVQADEVDAIERTCHRIDFVGLDGKHLSDKWRDGPITYLGLQSAGFPNLLMLAGPQSGSGFTNFGRGVEECVDWATAMLAYMRDNGFETIATTSEFEDAWVEEVKELYGLLLLGKVKSWFTGYNSNIEGRDKMRYLAYNGGAPRYRKTLAEVAQSGYRGFELR